MTSVEFRRDGHIGLITLNRPEALNAINAEMDTRLAEIWDEVNRDPDIWAAILTGAGERAFCVGADIKAGEGEARCRVAFGGGLTGVGGPLVELKKPLIAAVRGYVLGGGFELAACSDIMVAADTAQFGIPETRVGIIGESGVLHRAMRQLPYRIAMAMILTGERINAETAFRYGLVNEVVAADKLDAAARSWADRINAASPLAVQAAKHAALSRLGWPLEVALATRYEPIEAYARSEDVVEGRKAMAERRKPEWRGR
jgi:enoyl-CoA hydratase/carnithine racemase